MVRGNAIWQQIRGRTLWQATKASAAMGGMDAPALISPPQSVSLSYGQLCDSARTLSDKLVSWGVKEGDLVATDLPNVAEGMLLHLACSRIGAAVATAKNADVLSKVGNVRCSVTATNSDWLAEGKVGALGSIQFADLLELQSGNNMAPDDGDRHTTDSALGYFGNGTPLTHGQALQFGEAMQSSLEIGPQDRVCVSITLYHAFGIGSACSAALMSGAAIVLPAVGGLQGCGVPSQRAEVTLDTMSSEKCTLLFADTHTLKALNDARLVDALEVADLSSLRGGVCKTGSGATILPETIMLKDVTMLTCGKAS